MKITKPKLLRLAGLTLSVLPPLIATLSYFPLWREMGAPALLSGWCLFLIILSALPLIKAIRARIKTPASYLVWLFLFLLFSLLSAIAAEVKVIAFTGFISNVIGAILIGAARRIDNEGK